MYDVGKYMIGPDFEFKVFPADSQYVALTLDIFTKDKLEVRSSVKVDRKLVQIRTE